MQENKEIYKDNIYKIFTDFRNDPSRRSVYWGQLCDQIYRWRTDYYEVIIVFENFCKEEKINAIPKDKESFYRYLTTSLTNKKIEVKREEGELGEVRIPKNQIAKYKALEDLKRVKENEKGRELTKNEENQLLNIVSLKRKEYEKIKMLKNINGMKLHSSDDNNPADEFFKQSEKEIFIKAVEFVLNDETQDRTRDCYRELITLYCIRNKFTEKYKFKDYIFLKPLLDKSIIENFEKTGNKPTQKQIYLKYHQDAAEDSAEVRASATINEFLKRLDYKLKENQ